MESAVLGITASLNDPSETLKVEIINPGGASLSDGTNSSSTATIDVTAWALNLIKVTPASDDDSNFNLTVRATATDGADTASADAVVAVTVDAVADTPNVSANAAISTDEDVESAVLGITASLNDASETLKVEVSNLPAGASLSDGTNSSSTSTTDVSTWTLNAIKVTPASQDHSNFNLTVTATATDGASQASDNTVVAVTVNAVNDTPTVADAPNDVTVDEDAVDSVIDISAVFADEDIATDGDTLTLTVVGNTNASLFTSTVVSGVALPITGTTLTLDYASDQNGSADITLRATDNDGPAFVESTFTVTVDAVNDLPTIISAPSDVVVTEDAVNTVMDFTTVYADVDIATNGDALVLSVLTNTNPSLFTSTDVSGTDLTLDYATNQNGTADITVRATDMATSALLDTSFTVTVNAANDAPTVAIAPAVVGVNEDAADSVIDISAVFTDVDIDTNSDTLTLSVAGNTNAALFTSTAISGSAPPITGTTLTLDYALNQSGTADITLRATDAGALFVETTLTVNITAVNDAPTVRPAPVLPAIINLNEDFIHTQIDLWNQFVDVEDANFQMTYTATSVGGDTGTVTVDPSAGLGLGNGFFHLFAVQHLHGSEQFEVKVTDTGGLSVSSLVTVNVAAVADAPNLSANASVIVAEDAAASLGISSSLVDADGSESLAVEISSLPGGASISDGVNSSSTATTDVSTWALGAIQVSPAADDDTDFNLTVTATATDAAGQASTNANIAVTVNAVADTPNLVANAAITTDEDVVSDPLGIVASLSDVTNEILSVQISGLPSGATLSDGSSSSSSGTTDVSSWSAITVLPPADFHGSFVLTVTATASETVGGSVASTSTPITVTVNSVNDAPVYQSGSYVNLDDVVEDDPPILINLATVFLDADLLDGDASDEQLTFYITIVEVPDAFVSTAMFDTAAFTTMVDGGNNLVIETTSPLINLPPFQDAHGYADITVRAQDLGEPPPPPAVDPVPLSDQNTFRITIASAGDDVPVAEDDHYSDTLVLEEDDDGPTLTLDQVLTIEEDSDPVSIPVLTNDYPGDVRARVVSVGQLITIDSEQHFWRTTTRLADPFNSGDTITVINGEVICAQCPVPSGNSTLNGGGLTDDVVLYKPLLDFNGEDTFTYTIMDNEGVEQSTATVTVLVTPKNDPPQPEPVITYVMDQATDLVVPVEEGLRTKVFDVDNTHVDGFGCDPMLPTCTPAAEDPQPDSLYFQITQATTEHGAIDSPWCCDGAFTYRPDAAFAGEDTFMFDVCDRPIATAPEENCVRDVVVTITVESIAGAPVGSSDETVEFDYQLAQTPLELPIGPEPNVLVIMDDSGSMHWDILTDQSSGVYYYDTGNYVYYVSPATSGGSVYGSTNVAPSEEAATGTGVWRLRNSTYNAVYYNPNIRYDPWKGLDASDVEFQDSPPTAARHNPLNASPVTDLTQPITYTGRAPLTQTTCGNVCVRYRWRYSGGRWRRVCTVYQYRCTTSSGFQNVVSTDFYVPRYYNWTDKDADGKLDSTPSPHQDILDGTTLSEGELVKIEPARSTYPKGTDRTDCETVADSCSYTEELQNFANWFTYSRNREMTAKTSLGQVVSEAENLRVGYAVLNRSSRRQPITSMNTSDRTGAKAALLDEIYQTVPSGGTPLRRALNKAGRYYECTSSNSMGTGASNPGDADCPVLAAPEGNCQQNFTLLFTDGTWNGSSPGLGNKDADNSSNFDGGVYASSYSTSLADVAMHYYERDLHTLNNEVPTTGRDQAGAADDAFEGGGNDFMHQHMSTFTVGFGVIGLVDPADVPTNYTQSFNWGSPTTSARKTDDVLHAAVNGRGEYLSASNTKQLADALTSAFEEFAQGSGTASAVSFNSQEVQEDTLIFRAFYNTKINTGDLVAQKLTETELVEEPVWSSAEALDLRTFDNRDILTYNPVTKLGIPFRTASLSSDQYDFFVYDPTASLTSAQKDAQVTDKVNYLRGDNSNERPTGALRERPSIKGRLGDIVHSTPVFVGRPNRLNREAVPYPQGELYSDFQDSMFSRDPMIYVTANDGMIHGFSSVDGTEVFGYVPNNMMLSEYGRDLTDLLNYEYSHKYFVDLTPAINDIYFDADDNGSKEWASVLIGGHGAGSKAYFALDVTNPALLDESTAASVVLWEFTHDDDTYPTDAAGSPLLTGSGGQRQDQLSPAQPVKDLGYSFSVPTLAMSNVVDSDGEQEWVVLFGNGFNSTAGIAKLFVLFVDKGTDGTWCHPDMVYNTSLTPTALPSDCVGKQDFVKLDTGFGVPDAGPRLGFPNGLGTPRAIDVDANGTVDYAYAGDVLGNFFRFDLTSSNSQNWSFEKIFEATYDNNGTTEIQPITSQPIVVNHPSEPDGFIVIFATGSYITIPDGSDNQIQSVYGLWDRLGPGLITRSDLVGQFYTNVDDATFGNVRLLSNNEVDYSAVGAKKGWFNDLNAVPAGGTVGVDNAEFPGERAIRNLQLKGGLIFVNSVIPRSDSSCVDIAGGFALSFCPENGGLACLDDEGIFDLDNDGEFDSNDEVNSRVVAGIRFEDAVPTDSSFIGDERITQLSDKSIDRTTTNTTGAPNTGRLSWKRLD